MGLSRRDFLKAGAGLAAGVVLRGAPYSAQASRIVVNASPTGPPVPPGGWKCIMADGFYGGYPLSKLWGPNRNDNAGDGGLIADCPGFNSNEVEVFNASQLSFKDGINLTAKYSKGRGGPGIDYVSGCLSSQPVLPVEGEAGFPITGFTFVPQSDSVLVLEARLALPNVAGGGENPAFWCQGDGTGADEIDFLDDWHYGTKHWGMGTSVWINHLNNTSNEGPAVYGNPADESDKLIHCWATEFNGPLQKVRLYLDGVLLTTALWLPGFPSKPNSLFLSHALRNVYGDHPTWTTGSTVLRARSIAAYQDAPHAGQGIVGGGIAPGTVVG